MREHTITDIDILREELDKVRKQLRKKEFVLDTILEASFAAYWEWDFEEDEGYVSDSHKKMFGRGSIDNALYSWESTIYPEDKDIFTDAFDAHVRSKGKIPFECEGRLFHSDGSLIWVFCKGAVVEWNGNVPVKVVGTHINITNLKKTENLLLQKTKQLSDKNKELEQFAYVASHDLQEPARTISSFIDLFNKRYGNTLEGDAIQYLKYINEATGRMQDLIEDLLEYSRIGRNKELQEIDCNELLEDVISDLDSSIHEANSEVIVDNLPVVKGYILELRILFMNLLSNAIKFRSTKTKPKIVISCTEEESRFVFEVKDNGIGIDKKYHDRIFEIFQRLHSRSEYKGSGIGLSHCKKIVELHGGNIWLTSSENKGSSFYFSLPK